MRLIIKLIICLIKKIKMINNISLHTLIINLKKRRFVKTRMIKKLYVIILKFKN